MATIIPPQIDVTDLDQESLETRLFELIDSVFPAWSSRDRRDFGNILLGLFAFVGDVLSYYLVRQGDEARFGTARLRSSMLALVKLIDYVPSGRTASSAVVRLSTADGNPVAADVAIPVPTVVSTAGGSAAVRFETTTGFVLLAGQSFVDITVENSRSAEEQYQSTGIADQRLPPLQSAPYLDGTVAVADQTSVFEEVRNFFESGPSDPHYVVEVDEFDRARIRFGDGANGRLPVGLITVTYRYGGGTSGVVEAGTLTRLDGTFVDGLGSTVALTATNPEASTTAQDRETVDQIRINAPASIRAPNRTVSREDFEVRAYETGRIARALMQGRAEDPGIAENAGILYLVANGGVAPTAADIDAVVAAIEAKPPCIGFVYDVVAAPFLDVAISTVVHLEPGADPIAARDDVVSRLEEYFSAERSGARAAAGERQIDFGFYLAESLETEEAAIPLSDITCEIGNALGVRKIDDRPDGILVNGVRADLDVPANRFPRLASVTVIDILTGPIT